MNICVVDGCGRRVMARQMCSKHYQHAMYHGKELPFGRTGRTVVPVTHPLYKVWGSIKNRCENPNNQSYSRYGGKGVTICPEWADFNNFYNDMHEGYEKGLWIDRIDGSKGYSKDNCRWVNANESNRNRSNVKVTPELARKIRELYANGRLQISLADEFGLDQTTISDIVRFKSWADV